MHYNPDYELQLITDASLVGVGVVLCHKYPNGEIKPITFASRTISSAEKHWSQIEREGLAIIFGVFKFNQYLYGRKFTLVCDNKHLIAIFNPAKGILQFSANRLRRWAVILTNNNYDVKYVKSENNLADGLSRLPIKDDENQISENYEVDYLQYFTEQMGVDSLVDFEFIRENTKFGRILLLKIGQNLLSLIRGLGNIMF